MVDKPTISATLPVPRWLSRAEKSAFRRIEGLRREAGKPVSAAEVERICDLVSLRGRIADLRRMYDHSKRKLRANPDWESDKAFTLAACRQIDAATAKAQRMERELHLGPGEA